MRLILIGHQNAYQLQSLLAEFFPFAPLTTEYASTLPSLSPAETALLTILENGHTARVIFQADGRQETASCPVTDTKKDTLNLAFARLAYPLLCAFAGLSLPYGIYTGIRPVKNARSWAKAGCTEEEIRQRFAEDYFVDSKKAALISETLHTQTPVLCATKKDSFSLFVFIPFCPSKCRYCSFISKAVGKDSAPEIERYLDLLIEELSVTAEQAAEAGLTLDTIYIGGGTPTVLSVAQLTRLLTAIDRSFPHTKETEYTVEAGRPDTITKEKLLCLRQHGVNRISINPQTFRHETLRAIGRSHTPLQILEAFALARESGFKNINMDLIAALPGEDASVFRSTVQTAVHLQPENITVHTLTVKRAADFRQEASFDPLADRQRRATATAMLEAGGDALHAAGYHPYYLYRQKNTIGCLENTGWTKDGFSCAYNIRIMEECQHILACGANASTKLLLKEGRIVRIFNPKFPYDYEKGKETVLAHKKALVRLLSGEIDTAHMPGVPDKPEKNS